LKILTVELVKKVRYPDDIPKGDYPEISFVGRSNVGKSSALNCLVGRNVLSPVSKSPGRTRHLLYFLVNEKFYLVDLPGYGYAQRDEKDRERWQELVEVYLSRRDNPRGIVQILDIRHEPSTLDMQMLSRLGESGKPTLFLLTKSDKLSKNRILPRVKVISQTLGVSDDSSMITFSARTGAGKKEVWGAITGLL